MHKTTLLKNLLIGFCLLVFSNVENANAQIVISAPNLGFSQACASASFNTYSTTFNFSPVSGVSPSNQFIIEMSDADGSFANPTVLLTTAAGSITTSPATLNFQIPTETAGEGYRIRIKSTAPAATSAGSATFAAYYKTQDSPFTINNLVSTGAFCSGGSYLLTIDNPGTGTNDSPLNYPSLTFKWYKETSPTTSVFVAEGETLEVTQEGTYFCETNYGTCTSNSYSNRVTITAVTSGEANAGIFSSLGNPFCPDQGATTLSTLNGTSYQWYKNGQAIAGATEQMYQTEESGNYSVQVDLGNCQASGSIALVSELFDASINVSEMETMEEGESITVVVTENALNPDFEWYLNSTLIPSATGNTYEATQFGDYTVIINENSGCTGSREFNFTIAEPYDPFPNVEKIPNMISPNGDAINDTWVIPQKYVSGTNTEVIIMNNQGKVVFSTKDYLNDWPQQDLELTSINQVYYYVLTTQNNETKKGSITVIK
ncbi:MAG: gliding motility-associated C-terminal domain-containing protein [Mangrovimonas sp.]|nr:gliding motility-associated C-terminal domain-containing protein [Mangrovimonas sp.]MCB0434149.1 gliding motility-associated C-terminal domain-containing protein [Mangrovimonas sp.]MCB0436130.1 gliding motility-associated C-terminal domain-containing protein [Mangrovimonas sp.]